MIQCNLVGFDVLVYGILWDYSGNWDCLWEFDQLLFLLDGSIRFSGQV